MTKIHDYRSYIVNSEMNLPDASHKKKRPVRMTGLGKAI